MIKALVVAHHFSGGIFASPAPESFLSAAIHSPKYPLGHGISSSPTNQSPRRTERVGGARLLSNGRCEFDGRDASITELTPSPRLETKRK